MNATHFILLFNIFNGTLYINKPSSSRDCFISVGSKDNSWPSKWTRMEINKTTTPQTCSIGCSLLNESSAKFAFYLNNGSYHFSDNISVACNGGNRFLTIFTLVGCITILIILVFISLHILCLKNKNEMC